MAKVRATMVVIGDTPEAQRIRGILGGLGVKLISADEAYRAESYGAVFFTDAVLTRRTRGKRVRSQRFCRIQRSAEHLREVGVCDIPPCITNANGIAVFSRKLVGSPLSERDLLDLTNAVREVERQCTRFRNYLIDKRFQDAALERKNRARRARVMA